MDWEEYKKIYYQYEMAVSQSRILRLVVGGLFKDFPKNLPADLRTVLTVVPEFFLKVIEKKDELIEKTQTPGRESLTVEELGIDLSPHTTFHEIHTHPLYDASVCMFVAQAQLQLPFSKINYEQLLHQQELSMLFAQVDAFMADTLRVICQVRPEVLKKSKQIDWATIVSAGGWQEVLDLLTEEYVYEFGWPPLPKRVKMLREQLGIEIQLRDSDWELIEEAENIRNIVTHNGGRISKEYIKRTRRRDLVVGDTIPLTSEYVESTEEVLRMFVSGLYLAVLEKFFGLNASDIHDVWRRVNEH